MRSGRGRDNRRPSIRDGDLAARLGGDEFAIARISPAAAGDIAALAHRVIDALGQPFDCEGQQVMVGISVGVAVGPADGDSADLLLQRADMALYRAKAEGRGVVRFYAPDMDAALQFRRVLEVELHQALANDAFELAYQPILNAQTTRLNGFEALLRWRHPTRGLVPPAEFIPLAEEIGLIIPIGNGCCAPPARRPRPGPAR